MKCSNQHGFTLLELTVVLTIIAVLIGSSAIIHSQQLDREQSRKTERELKIISKALDQFVRIHGRLPCPAAINAAATDNSGFGRESSDCSDSSPPSGITRVEYPATSGNYLRVGGVPVKALKLSNDFADDEWDGRYTYVVNEALIGTLDEDSTGTIAIQDEAGNTITTAAAYTLLSNGPTRKGAINNNNLTVNTACDATNKDGGNCANTGIYTDAKINNGTTAANFFDDQVVWKTRKAIFQDSPIEVTETGSSGGGGSSSSSSGGTTCTMNTFATFDASETPTRFSWVLTRGVTTITSHTYAMADNTGVAVGVTVPGLSPSTSYTVTLTDSGSAGLLSGSSAFRFRDTPNTASIGYKNGAEPFISCTKTFTLDATCNDTNADDTMTCTTPPRTCDVRAKWHVSESTGDNYGWALTTGATTLASGSITSPEQGTQVISGLTPGTTYTYTITDLENDGFTGTNPMNEAIGLMIDLPTEIAGMTGSSVWSTCTKSFSLDSDCNYSGTNTMTCTSGSSSSSSSSSSSGATPPATADLLLWLDATDIDADGSSSTGEPGNGDGVKPWYDKSGNGNNFDNGAGPIYAASESKFNNLPAVYFDGTSFLQPGNPTPFIKRPDSEPFSIAVAYGDTSHTSERTTLFFDGSNGSDRCYGIGGAMIYANYRQSSSAMSEINSTSALASVTVFDGADNASSTIGRTDASIVSIGAQPDVDGMAYLGGTDGNTICNATDPLNGHIAEVLMWNKALTPTEVCAVKEYFDTKWGTAVAAGCGSSSSSSSSSSSGGTTCSITEEWDISATPTVIDNVIKIKNGATVVDSYDLTSAPHGTTSHSVSGLSPSTTYTFEITDTGNGFGGPSGSNYIRAKDVFPTVFANKADNGTFTSCTLNFVLDASCNATPATPTMNCTPSGPPNSSDLLLWVDSTDIDGDSSSTTGEPSNGAFSSSWSSARWADKSGNGHHFQTVLCASGPRYMSSVASFNSKPAVYFSGSACIENTTFPMRLPDLNAFTVATATMASSATSLNQIAVINSERTGGGGACWGLSGNNIHANTSVSAQGTGPGSITVPTAAISAFSGSGTAAGRVHQTDVNLAAITSVLIPGGWTTRLGRAVAAAGDCNFISTPFTGYMSEILIYNRALSAAERCDVMCYLDNKWGSQAATGMGCASSSYCP